MKRVHLQFSLICILLFQSCNLRAPEMIHWIMFYLHLDEVKCSISDYELPSGEMYYHIAIDYEKTLECTYEDPQYEYYAELHGDYANDWRPRLNVRLEGVSGITNDLSSIAVLSLCDWDENHKTGDSLNDISWFAGLNSTDFIHNGKKTYFSIHDCSELFKSVYNNQEFSHCCKPVDKRVEDVLPDDLFLLGDYRYDAPGENFYPVAHIFIPKPNHCIDHMPIGIKATDIEGCKIPVRVEMAEKTKIFCEKFAE